MPEVRRPTVRRRELGDLLRKLRNNEKDLTVDQVADRLLCSTSKESHMETGHDASTLRDIRDLCDRHGITDEAMRSRLMTLAREGKEHAWWNSYKVTCETYVVIEADAVSISEFKSSAMRILLRTADYRGEAHPPAHTRPRRRRTRR